MSQSALISWRRVCQLALLMLVLVLGAAVPANAQASSGVITGTVSDAQGGILPGVTLTLRNTDTGVTRTAVTESGGRYRLAGLPPGRYELKADLPGFAPVDVRDITLTIGLEVGRNLTMQLQGVQESLTVTGQAPVVETTKSEVSAVITQQQIEMLPISGRVAVSLSLLLPGTSADTVRPRRNNVNVGSGGVGIFASNFLVDGAMNMSSKAGEPRQDFPQAAIREFKVNVSQTPAEFGGRTGGVVTIVTKAGTNQFTGEAFEFFRDKSLNAMNIVERQQHDQLGVPKPAFRRNQFGGALGGPIVKNRLHFFVASERTDTHEAFTVNTGKPQFYSALEGSFPNPSRRTLGFARGDLQINSQQNMFVRYGRQGVTIWCENCGGTSSAFSGDGLYLPAGSMVAGHTWVLSPRILNEVRFQKAYEGHYQGPPGTTRWKQRGVFSPDRNSGRTPNYNFPSLIWGSDSDLIVWLGYREIGDDFSFTFNQKGSHTLKAGGAFLNMPVKDDVPGDPLGTWTFGADQPFNPADPASVANLKGAILFTASFPPLTREVANHLYDGYVQDEWKPRSNLTLNLGLRYDLQTKAFNRNLDLSLYPRPLPFVAPASRGDNNNVAPRLGFAWDLRDNGKSVVRSGYGVVYGALLAGATGNEITTLRQTSIRISNPNYPDPYQGRDPLLFASTALPNITTLSNDLRNAAAHTTNVGFSQELKSDLAIHVDGAYTRTVGFPVTIDVNEPNPVTRARPDPTWGRIVQTQSIGTDNYKALFVRLDKRFTHRHQYVVSYTLAGHTNNFAGSGSRTDRDNPAFDVGPATADRRHSFVASGSVLLPFDVALGAVWTLRSTMPFNALAGKDVDGDGVTNDYVPGTTKNQGNRNLDLALVNAWRAVNALGPISAGQIDSNRSNTVDVRVSKSIPLGGTRKIELVGQVFNLLGTDNLYPPGSGAWVTNALSDSFGRILTAQNRQQAEVAVRVIW